MDWMKIYIDDLLMSDLKDWQLMAIMRFQALYTQLEEMPNDIQLKRFLSKKERDFCANYIEVIQQRAQNDIESANKKSKRNKKYYKSRLADNKALTNDSDVLKDVLQDAVSDTDSVAPDKTRRDKTRIINNPSLRSGSSKVDPPFDLPALNSVLAGHGLPQVQKLTVARKQKLLARARDSGGFERFLSIMDNELAQSAFLRGDGGGRAWQANFDFFLQPSSWQKVVEGVYRDKAGKGDDAAYWAELERKVAAAEAEQTLRERTDEQA